MGNAANDQGYWQGVEGTIYLIHFDQPYRHARHYCGWASDLEARLAAHRSGNGSRMMAVIAGAGIQWRLVSNHHHHHHPNPEGITMTMQLTSLTGEIDEHLAHTRVQALTELSAAIRSLEEAAAHVQALREVDIEFAHGRDGRDVATHIDDAIRSARAGHAVIGMIVGKETPW